MGYSVYEHGGRWQGYGVPAYCDHKKCFEEIDRGMGFQHEIDKEECYGDGTPNLFVCRKHSRANRRSVIVDLEKEHPGWLQHILTDETWEQWRNENPDLVEKYKHLLESSKEKSFNG